MGFGQSFITPRENFPRKLPLKAPLESSSWKLPLKAHFLYNYIAITFEFILEDLKEIKMNSQLKSTN